MTEPDSQAGDDNPTEAIQRLCDDKILISSPELAERFTKLFNHYAERLAARRAVEELKLCLKHVPMPKLSYEAVENRIAELEAGFDEKCAV